MKKKMSEAKEKVNGFLENLTQFVTFEAPQSYKNLTIIPLILKDEPLEFVTIREAEDKDLGYIQEQQSESVATLQAINQGTNPILIPYMQVVKGGKQDRTIFEPILVPAGSTLVIPSKCIEHSRWSYRSAEEQNTKRFKTEQKMGQSINAKAIRAAYVQTSAQSEVWNSIESMSSQMNLCHDAAPTRSGIQIQETQKQKIDDYQAKFKLGPNQAGIIGLINNQVVAVELYGNSAAFQIFWKDLINSFAVEALLRSETQEKVKPLKPAELSERALHCFENFKMQYQERPGTGMGTVVEFADPNLVWAGIALVHENKFAHFYVVGKSILPDEKIRTRQMQASQLQRRINVDQQQRPF
jgi:hypothetical protein